MTLGTGRGFDIGFGGRRCLRIELLLVLLSFELGSAVGQCPVVPGYVFTPLMDSGGNDIAYANTTSVPAIAEICNADPSCAGFNTQGWYKYTIRPGLQWTSVTGSACMGMYTRIDWQIVSYEQYSYLYAAPNYHFSMWGDCSVQLQWILDNAYLPLWSSGLPNPPRPTCDVHLITTNGSLVAKSNGVQYWQSSFSGGSSGPYSWTISSNGVLSVVDFNGASVWDASCPAGAYMPAGQTACTDCPQGQTSTLGSTSCTSTECSPGQLTLPDGSCSYPAAMQTPSVGGGFATVEIFNLVSASGEFTFGIQSDCNIELQDQTGTVLWSSATSRVGGTVCHLYLQADGNFVAYTATDNLWDPPIAIYNVGHPPYSLTMQDDGMLALTDADGLHTFDLNCPPGYILPPGQSTCSQCPPGFTSTGFSATNCHVAPPPPPPAPPPLPPKAAGSPPNPPALETSPTGSSSKSSSGSAAAIGGGVAGGLLLLVVLALVALLLVRRRKKKNQQAELPVLPSDVENGAKPTASPPPYGSVMSARTGGASQLSVLPVNSTVDYSFSTYPATALPPDACALEVLKAQMDALADGGELLCGRYRLGSRVERRVGGQGLVQFAAHAYNADELYAIKFYLDHSVFDMEAAHYGNRSLHHILPAVDNIVPTDSVHILGRPLPPFVVMRKGESLDEWQRRSEADFASAMHIMLHIVQRVADIHDAGIVHRDLKPGNIIYYPARNEWTVIDYGAAVSIGSNAPIACTLAYAAPETVLALKSGATWVRADAAVDVWALGLIAWELLTRTRVFMDATKVMMAEVMEGRRPLPWEDTGAPSYASNMRHLGFMRDGVLRMLARDPSQRITLAEALRSWRSILQRETTHVLPPGQVPAAGR